MYEAYIDRKYYMNRVCRSTKNPDQKMVVKRVLHPTSMKHPNKFILQALGNKSTSTDVVPYFQIEFRVDGRWVPAQYLFEHRINELEAGALCNQVN
ncbi:hypothetical protein [Acinetobacter sp. NigerLNRRAM0016]